MNEEDKAKYQDLIRLFTGNPNMTVVDDHYKSVVPLKVVRQPWVKAPEAFVVHAYDAGQEFALTIGYVFSADGSIIGSQG